MFVNPRLIEAVQHERYTVKNKAEPIDTGWYRSRRGVIVRMAWSREPWWRAFVPRRVSSTRAIRG